jgi:hypothetical protein
MSSEEWNPHDESFVEAEDQLVQENDSILPMPNRAICSAETTQSESTPHLNPTSDMKVLSHLLQ